MATGDTEEEEAAASACTLYRCVCCWHRLCSPRIPRVVPGRDFVCIPAGADDSPAWSLLVGLLSASIPMIFEDSLLGLHRFRVARSGKCVLGMQRFRKDADRWEQAGDTFPFHYKSQMTKLWNGDFLQGCAVLPDDTILVSLRPAQGVFLTFNCSDCTWTVVTTSENTQTAYVPILGPGVYIQGDDEKDDGGAVYFLRDNRVYAYKLRYLPGPGGSAKKAQAGAAYHYRL
uniref:Uncharacterized protein n=1 Tax=Aegilops tauschii TaxID=37682 RepID=M8B2S4_AEGTA